MWNDDCHERRLHEDTYKNIIGSLADFGCSNGFILPLLILGGVMSTTQRRVHEDTYRGIGPASFVHRRRLSRTISIFECFEIPVAGTLADFGCSNGFVLSVLAGRVFPSEGWRFFGLDRSRRLLALAEAKALPNTEFHSFNLNVRSGRWCNEFDIVTCFETLEHVGNYHNAVLNLYEACKKGGKIIISVPNERGLPGIVKYLSRPLVRRRAYHDFFERRSRLRYFLHLVSNRYIDSFREPPSDWYGHHLGFDSLRFAEFLDEALLSPRKCKMLSAQASAGMFNHFHLLEKVG